MAKKITMEDLKKLPPEKRIAVLKKFEEKRKKDIEKAEELIKGTEEELERKEETEQEIEEKSRELLEERIEENTEDIELEGIIEEAKVSAEEAEFAPQYGKPLEELYQIATPSAVDSMSELRERAAEGSLSEYDRERVDFYQEQFEQLSAVEAAYIKDQEKRINVMKIKDALERIKEYKTMI